VCHLPGIRTIFKIGKEKIVMGLYLLFLHIAIAVLVPFYLLKLKPTPHLLLMRTKF
jgi:hypothetical protein